jgi:hypothetical protein
MSDTRFCDNGCGYKLPSEYSVDETTCGACLDAHDMITTQIASATADTNTTHKGDTRMTTNEQRHGEQIRLLVSLITDEEMRPDIIDINNTYKTVRMNLLAAARGLRDIDAYSLNHNRNYIDLQLHLHQIMLDLRSDELALLELISNMNEASESAQV